MWKNMLKQGAYKEKKSLPLILPLDTPSKVDQRERNMLLTKEQGQRESLSLFFGPGKRPKTTIHLLPTGSNVLVPIIAEYPFLPIVINIAIFPLSIRCF